MSKIMQSMYRAARDARRPIEDRKRYSVRRFDAGFDNYQAARAAGMAIYVRLDGELVQNVLTADELAGSVLMAEMPVRLTPDGKNIVSVERRGIVCVELVDEP